jgi:DNA-directed RNA polymerase specialized sigma24 family protein
MEELVAAAATGDQVAWQALWAELEPRLSRIVAQPRFLGRLGQREDDRRNIVVDVMARLRERDFERLSMYLAARESNPQLQFMTWLRVVAKRAGIDYMRRHPDYVDRRRQANASAPGAWIDPGTLPSHSRLGGDRPPITYVGTAAELLRYAADAIPDAQRRALELWVSGAGYDDIADAVGFPDAGHAERAVRAAIERLRRRFRPAGSEQ